VFKSRMTTGEKWFFFCAIPVVIISAVMALFLVVIPSGSQDPTVARNPSLVVTAPEAGVTLPLSDLNGTWSADDNGTTFTAEISGDVVKITMAREGASMVYWYGSFDSSAAAGQNVVSNKLDFDKVVMSGSDSKLFNIRDSSIAFEVTAMGMTKSVVMNRG
jgi:hypothetical protein